VLTNSFTQRNNLAGLLTELAAARDLSVRHELISVGEASLRTHWNAGRAAKAIATGGYNGGACRMPATANDGDVGELPRVAASTF
jgi:hypothetical protein